MNRPPAARPMVFRSAARTHAGAVRPLNEDRFVDRPEARIWAVADGMGGHHDGEAASTLVAEALGGLEGFSSGYAFLNAVVASLEAANEALVNKAAALPEGSVTGTTVVVLLIHEDHAACVWAGDSRAYRLRGAEFSPLTRDHSVLQQLIDAGALAPADAAADRRAHIITRAVGAAENLELDSRYAPVLAGDRFLLCSDGLTGCVPEAEIARLLGAADIASAADRLLALALSQGPTDNVTFVAIEAVEDEAARG